MSPDASKRKLAAIMFTDMVGYTALMQKDEPKARELIERHRIFLKPLVEKHGGEVIQYVGDGTFCRFESAIEAVSAAQEIHQVLEVEPEINLRIGIHIGDVVVKGDEVYGDGVNVASRLEPLAEPGGICVSNQVYENIKNQPGLKLTSLGKQELKNVDEPIEVFTVEREDITTTDSLEKEEGAAIAGNVTKEKGKNFNKLLFAGAAVAALTLITLWINPFSPSGERALEASGEIRSIAVLPFDNMSNDPDQEYFSDGMTEALITDISKIRALKVISRTSIMRYKGTDKSLPEIARELNVDAILEGSVMHAEGEVRITVQLIRASTDEHLWAESYTDKLENIMILQSRIARAVAEEIKLTLSPEEEINIGGERKVNPEAYKLYLQAQRIDPWVRSFEDQREAIKLLQEAVAIDDNFVDGWVLISERYSILHIIINDGDRERVNDARRALERAKELDPSMIEVQIADGHFHYFFHKDYISALESYYGVLRIDPNNSVALEYIGYVQRRMGKWNASLEKLLEVYKRDPYNTDLVTAIAESNYYLRNFSQSKKFYRKSLDISPQFTHPYIALAENGFQRTGNPEDALAAMATTVQVNDMGWYLSEKAYFLSISGDLEGALEMINSLSNTEFQSGTFVNNRNYHLSRIHRIAGENSIADNYSESALQELEIAFRLEPENNYLLQALSFTYAYLSLKEEAKSVTASWVDKLGISIDTFMGSIVEMEAAKIYTIIDEYDMALDKIELLLSIPSPLNVGNLKADPIWKPLYDLPRYKEIVKKYGADA